MARIADRSDLEEEVRLARQFCELCATGLHGLVEAYAQAPAVDGGSEEWRPRANALWQASRDYLRRHRGCDHMSRKLQRHGSTELGVLAMEYELEASALLALQHAADAYRRARPDAA